MSRFITKGRADPWSIPSPRRCHNRTIYGELQPMDRASGDRTWGRLILAVFAVCFLLPLLMRTN